MDKGTRLIWAGILALFGGFMLFTNAQYLLDYQSCMANPACAEGAPASNTEAGLSLTLGVLLLWGAVRAYRPGGAPSGLMLMAISLLCLFYIYKAWTTSGVTVPLVVVCIVLLGTLRALFRKR